MLLKSGVIYYVQNNNATGGYKHKSPLGFWKTACQT